MEEYEYEYDTVGYVHQDVGRMCPDYIERVYKDKNSNIETEGFTDSEKIKLEEVIGDYVFDYWSNEKGEKTSLSMSLKNPPEDAFERNGFIYNITKCVDDWYFLSICLRYEKSFDYYIPFYHFECDQFDGLMNCINYVKGLLALYQK